MRERQRAARRRPPFAYQPPKGDVKRRASPNKSTTLRQIVDPSNPLLSEDIGATKPFGLPSKGLFRPAPLHLTAPLLGQAPVRGCRRRVRLEFAEAKGFDQATLP